MNRAHNVNRRTVNNAPFVRHATLSIHFALPPALRTSTPFAWYRGVCYAFGALRRVRISRNIVERV